MVTQFLKSGYKNIRIQGDSTYISNKVMPDSNNSKVVSFGYNEKSGPFGNVFNFIYQRREKMQKVQHHGSVAADWRKFCVYLKMSV